MTVSGNILKFTNFRVGLGRVFRSQFRRHRFDIFVGLILLVMAVWLGLFGWKAYRGYSKMEGTPPEMMRVQIVNGSGNKAIDSSVSDRLGELLEDGMGIEVVAAESFDIRQSSQTMIISRDEDLTKARQLARHLGLDPEAVFFKRLENNRHQVSATLVLGADYRGNVLGGNSNKEQTGKS